MTVLVTGPDGVLGSNLVRVLCEKGYSVNVFLEKKSTAKTLKGLSISRFYGDILNLKELDAAIKGCDVVIHGAASTSVFPARNPFVRRVNVDGTKNIFEASIRKNIRKVIYAESSAVYEGTKKFPSSETDASPQSVYAKSKIATHFIAKDFLKSHGLISTGLRYFNVYGPKQDYRRTIPPVFSAFIIKLLQKKSPTIYGDGSKKRDFVYVDDVNNFHLMCINNDKTNNKVFNIGSGKNYSIKDVYEEISLILDSDISPLFEANFDFEAQENLANINEARKIGWNPTTNLSEGLKKSIDYIKENVI